MISIDQMTWTRVVVAVACIAAIGFLVAGLTIEIPKLWAMQQMGDAK